MAHTYEELHEMTVAELRDVAHELETDEVDGYSTMHKEELLPKICSVLGIEAHVHHDVVGIDKSAVKAQMASWKHDRDEALAAGDAARLKIARRRIRRLKRKIRAATV